MGGRKLPAHEVAETSRTPPLNPPPFGKCPVCPSPAEGANGSPTKVQRRSGFVRMLQALPARRSACQDRLPYQEHYCLRGAGINLPL